MLHPHHGLLAAARARADVLVAPCATNLRDLPSEVELVLGEDPVPRRSAVNLDSVESVSVVLLVERIGVLSGPRMKRICEALAVATDCT